MDTNKTVDIIEFTDPVCTWCWGSEPILRALESRYGDQIKIKYIMGGLVKDIRDFYDSYNDIGRDPQRSNTQIAKHWLEASARHGMPVRVDGFRLFSDEHPSSYPQNIAYKAAQLEDPILADKFLRRLREACATEARQTNRRDVLIELASESGFDADKFRQRLSDGSAEAAFKEDLAVTRKYRVQSFPTFLLRYSGSEILIGGYQSVESFASQISAFTSGAVTPVTPIMTEQGVSAFIQKYGRAVPVDIQMSFGVSAEETSRIVEKLLDAGVCRKIAAGNGYFIELS